MPVNYAFTDEVHGTSDDIIIRLEEDNPITDQSDSHEAYKITIGHRA